MTHPELSGAGAPREMPFAVGLAGRDPSQKFSEREGWETTSHHPGAQAVCGKRAVLEFGYASSLHSRRILQIAPGCPLAHQKLSSLLIVVALTKSKYLFRNLCVRI